jgi:hypothetical protein
VNGRRCSNPDLQGIFRCRQGDWDIPPDLQPAPDWSPGWGVYRRRRGGDDFSSTSTFPIGATTTAGLGRTRGRGHARPPFDCCARDSHLLRPRCACSKVEAAE